MYLTGVIHQLDVALEDVATQRGGLVFVYNMYGSKYANFDYDLSQKMLTLLKGKPLLWNIFATFDDDNSFKLIKDSRLSFLRRI